MENLPNEFFYEIFDYLDGYDICKAVSNLNYCFQQLLDSPYLFLKINLHLIYCRKLMNASKKIIQYNHKIFSLPFAHNDQFSTIEHLIIDHPCAFKELSAILSYTPALRRLKFSHSNDNNSTTETIKPIKLLTNLLLFIKDESYFMLMSNGILISFN
jgi:hypothetical protein